MVKTRSNKSTKTEPTMNTSSGDTVVEFLKTADTLIPKNYKISPIKWKYAVRSVLRGKNIMVVGPQGCGKTSLAFTLSEVLGRPLYNIPLGSTQDPRSVIVGNTHFKQGEGTFVANSYFVNAIQQPNAIILLDELSRAHPDAWNLLMPVLDAKQRFLRIDESPDTPTVKVADGVTFIATANIGHAFTATRVLDAALRDRFIVIEVDPLDKSSEYELLMETFPTLDTNVANTIAAIADNIRTDARSTKPTVSNIISTRMTLELAELIIDGFSLIDAAEVTIFTAFPDDGGTDSERSYVKKVVQKYLPTTADSRVSPFDLGLDDAFLPWN